MFIVERVCQCTVIVHHLQSHEGILPGRYDDIQVCYTDHGEAKFDIVTENTARFSSMYS